MGGLSYHSGQHRSVNIEASDSYPVLDLTTHSRMSPLTVLSVQRFLQAALFLPLMIAGCGEPDKPSVPLYLAVQRGDINQLERHIHWGTDIDRLGPDGNRPIHILAERGNIVAVKRLLDGGADIDAEDSDGYTAVQRALFSGRTQLASLLVERGAEFDPSALLIDVARQDVPDRDVISWLVARGADLEHTSQAGDTALIIAIRKRDHRLVRHLVDQGADVNQTNRAGEAPLAIAERLGQEEIADLLRRHGATVESAPG